MSLQIGQQLSSYEITSLIGKGGMGEVYRAKDTKLKRDVAIKILPDEFSRDTDRVSRFQREAESLAALNHQNIAAIYDLQQSDATRFLILEFVEGDTLADILKKRGALPVDESLQIAKQICEALEAAHEKGIIHRDLKPANVKITPDGKVKVLDFGLAKAFEPETSKSNLSQSPTLSMAATNAGVILGTAAYMSPEQAKGRAVDKRTDIFAFGCVLYEMLTGRAVFDGEDVQDILGAVLKSDPDWTRLPSETPPGIRKLLRRCLEKNVKNRRCDGGDVRIDIEEALAEPVATPATPPARGSRLAWIAAAAGVLLAVVFAIPALRYLRETPPPDTPEARLEINTPATADPVSFALSPDGRQIVFISSGDGISRLWLRSLATTTAQPLTGTEGAAFPFWSPDSRSVGFFADSKLKRIEIDGGSVRDLVRVPVPAGGAWSRDGVILFPSVPDSPLYRISANGGEPAPLTQLEPQQSGHRSPQFLPDGRHFLYYVTGSPQVRGIYVGEIGSGGSRRLLDADTPAVYSSGHLFFVHQGTLFALSMDPVRLEPAGNPHPVAERVTFDGKTGIVALSASAAGPIAYRTGSSGGKRQLAWFDRSGEEIAKVGDPESFGPAYLSISPDNRRLALQRTTSGNTDIWLLDLGRGGAIRLTSDTAPDIAPIWSPDGDRIVFSSVQQGRFDLYQQVVTGATSAALLVTTAQPKQATDWSSNGRFLLYRSFDPKTDWDIWALPLDGDRKPFPVVRTNFEERDGQFSPDGKWIAYQSNESGRFEIYVQPFPGPGTKSLISTNGGAQVRWRRDGRELFYITLDGRLMAVPFGMASSSQAVKIGAPISLFFARLGAVQDVSLPNYIVSPDGERFLIDTVVEEAASPITVILNWHPEPAK